MGTSTPSRWLAPRTSAAMAILQPAEAPSVRNTLPASAGMPPSRAAMKLATSWRTASMPWLLT
jgi:hypothetical protein